MKKYLTNVLLLLCLLTACSKVMVEMMKVVKIG